jgi:hypothetical protein
MTALLLVVRVDVWVTGTHLGDELAVWVPAGEVAGGLVEVGGVDGLGEADADADELGEPDGEGGPDGFAEPDADGEAVPPPCTSSVSGGDVEGEWSLV